MEAIKRRRFAYTSKRGILTKTSLLGQARLCGERCLCGKVKGYWYNYQFIPNNQQESWDREATIVFLRW